MSSGGVWRKLQAARPAWSLRVPTWEPGQALLTAAWGWEGGTETGGALRASPGDLGCQETGRSLGLGFGVRGTLPSPESGSAPHRYFFSSLISASASLLCLITILLYVFIQYSVNPEVLRTHTLYEGTGRGGGGLLSGVAFSWVTRGGSLSLQLSFRESSPSGGRQSGPPLAG